MPDTEPLTRVWREFQQPEVEIEEPAWPEDHDVLPEERVVAATVRARAQLADELKRLQRLHADAVAEIEAELERLTRPLAGRLDRLDTLLSAWHRRAYNEKLIGLKAPFPYGTLVLGGAPTGKLDVLDEGALLAWAEEHAPEAIIPPSEPRVDKAKVKVHFRKLEGEHARESRVVDTDGVEVPGVRVLFGERSWKVAE